MNKEDFLAKLATVPEEAPDEEDRADLKEAADINDGTALPLEEVKSALDFSGSTFGSRSPCTRSSAKTPSWMGYPSTSTSSTSWPGNRGPAPSCPRPGQLFSFPSGPLPGAGGFRPRAQDLKKGGIPCGCR